MSIWGSLTGARGEDEGVPGIHSYPQGVPGQKQFGNHCLRSSGLGLLKVRHRAKMVTRGDRAFEIRAPRLWNSLPENLRLTKSLSGFKTLLKTNFYRLAFPPP